MSSSNDSSNSSNSLASGNNKTTKTTTTTMTTRETTPAVGRGTCKKPPAAASYALRVNDIGQSALLLTCTCPWTALLNISSFCEVVRVNSNSRGIKKSLEEEQEALWKVNAAGIKTIEVE